MKQNIYDNNEFYKGYITLRDGSHGLNEVLEIPAFRSLLPDLKGKRILDLGCGFGEACKWYVSQGAVQVIGVDISDNMLDRAKDLYSDECIEYIRQPIEEINFSQEQFDLVLSSLAFHYVADFRHIAEKIHYCLKPNGFLIFSQEHPVATAKMSGSGWCENGQGQKRHWILDNYQEEGMRKQHWFVDGVIKYHRTIATIFNTLLAAGFTIVKVLEPAALKEEEACNAELKNERRRPPFLMLKAQKITDLSLSSKG